MIMVIETKNHLINSANIANKILNKTEIEENYFPLIMTIYKDPTANV